MTRVTCRVCRLRFGGAAAAALASCPECGRALEDPGSAAASMGFRLFGPADLDPALPLAVEAALPIPAPRQDRS
jgi:hypothetical protein